MIVYKILLEKEFSTLKNQKVSYGSAVDKKEKALLFRVIRGNAASFIVVK